MTKVKKITEAKRRTVPKEFRQLPADAYTHDAADPERVHKNDPKHVIAPLLREKAKREAFPSVPPIAMAKAAVDAELYAWCEDKEKLRHLDQAWVDLWKARTILAWIGRKGIHETTAHMWFPDSKNAGRAGIRQGPQPPRDRLPKHMRNLNLTFSAVDWPMRLRDLVQKMGKDPQKAIEEVERKINAQKAHRAVEEAKRQAAENVHD